MKQLNLTELCRMRTRINPVNFVRIVQGTRCIFPAVCACMLSVAPCWSTRVAQLGLGERCESVLGAWWYVGMYTGNVGIQKETPSSSQSSATQTYKRHRWQRWEPHNTTHTSLGLRIGPALSRPQRWCVRETRSPRRKRKKGHVSKSELQLSS